MLMGMLDMPAGSEGEGPDGLSEAQTGKRQLRLVGVVDQLKRRLDLLRDENLQLESMLHAADARTAGRKAAAAGTCAALAIKSHAVGACLWMAWSLPASPGKINCLPCRSLCQELSATNDKCWRQVLATICIRRTACAHSWTHATAWQTVGQQSVA